MKKGVIYIVIFLFGIAIGYILFLHKGSNQLKHEPVKNSYLAKHEPFEDKKQDFIQSASTMLGKSIIINGIVEEAYKNKNNELVLYLKDANIPLIVNCTLNNSDLQVLEPISLGETINLQGIFTQLSEEMYLADCQLIDRTPRER